MKTSYELKSMIDSEIDKYSHTGLPSLNSDNDLTEMQKVVYSKNVMMISKLTEISGMSTTDKAAIRQLLYSLNKSKTELMINLLNCIKSMDQLKYVIKMLETLL